MPPLAAARRAKPSRTSRITSCRCRAALTTACARHRGSRFSRPTARSATAPTARAIQALGAPNLTDNVWLYGGGQSAIIDTISKGRNGVMPAWGAFLGPSKVHLLAAYVYGLSKPAK